MKKVIRTSLLLILIANFLYIIGPSIMNTPDSLFVYFYMHNVNLNINFTIIFLLLYSWAVLDEVFQMNKNKSLNLTKGYLKDKISSK